MPVSRILRVGESRSRSGNRSGAELDPDLGLARGVPRGGDIVLDRGPAAVIAMFPRCLILAAPAAFAQAKRSKCPSLRDFLRFGAFAEITRITFLLIFMTALSWDAIFLHPQAESILMLRFDNLRHPRLVRADSGATAIEYAILASP